MNNKIDSQKIWRIFTFIFIFIIAIVFYINNISQLFLIPIIIIYLFINSIIFNSYFLGMVGNYFFNIRNIDKAFYYYEKALKKNTKNVLAICNYSSEILKSGDGKKALEYFKKAYEINTNPLLKKDILSAMGSCYWIINDIDKAIQTFEDIKSSYSYVNADVLTTLGYLYFTKKDYEKALENTNKALQDNPEHAAAWDNIGQICYMQSNYDESKKAFLKALEYNQNMVDSLYYLGMIYDHENDIKTAKNYFNKANSCNITSLNTITKEQIEKMYNKYKNL